MEVKYKIARLIGLLLLLNHSPLFAQQAVGIVEQTGKGAIPWPAIKTNLAMLGAGVSNLGIELKLSKQLSLDIPFIYSPYKISSSYFLKALALQPELRYWLNQDMKGHFIGAHAHIGYYNVAWGKEERYQDRNGNSPLWGYGLSYGYAMKIHKQLGVEFTLGGGYVNLRYDTFRNEPDGELLRSERRDYWGITRVGINLIYQLTK